MMLYQMRKPMTASRVGGFFNALGRGLVHNHEPRWEGMRTGRLRATSALLGLPLMLTFLCVRDD